MGLEKENYMRYMDNEMNHAQESIDVNLVMLKELWKTLKNWTGENENIDNLIQKNANIMLYIVECLERIPFGIFKILLLLSTVVFCEIYSADWPEG